MTREIIVDMVSPGTELTTEIGNIHERLVLYRACSLLALETEHSALRQ